MSISAWRDLLGRWARELRAAGETNAELRPGVTAAEIKSAEARLGTSLPPSYREFLAVTNGWRIPGGSIDHLWSAAEIDWFRVRNQGWIDAYNTTFPGLPPAPPVSDAEYIVYRDEQDCVRFRPEYLATALEISDVGDSAIYLLNPRVVFPNGEWEAWFFANWLPGAVRYCSFWELMRDQHDSF